MPIRQYPFIDIAVHGTIRERFARGEALVLFSDDLTSVIWANGAGAALFGYANLYEFIDEGAGGQPAALRQLRGAAARLRAGGSDQTATLRIFSGFRSRLAPVSLTGVRLFDATPAILLSGGTADETDDIGRRAQRIIAGLDDDATHVAVLDAAGGILATSPGLDGLGIADTVLDGLVADVADGRDRLAKRMIPTQRGRVPAAIARLCDEPPMHLLFAIEADEADQRMPDQAGEDTAPSGVPAATDGGKADEGTPPANGPDDAFRFDPDAKAVRFVWRIDAAGRFSEISEAFAATVGPNAADVVGRRFEDVANVFGFDRDGVISDLLRRRDTWSGKSVAWPVQGTNLTVPVDLAALPTYTRERTFDGFRGFGVVRVADAAEDVEAIGLLLSGPQAAPSTDTDADTGKANTETTQTPAVMADAEASGAAASEAPDQEEAASEPDSAGAGPEDGAAAPDAAASEPDEAHDPFHGEMPALRIVPTPGRRETDKVIDLEQRRLRPRDPLSSGEQAAFREIGKRLANAFGPEKIEDDQSAAPQAEAEAVPSESAAVAETDGEADTPDDEALRETAETSTAPDARTDRQEDGESDTPPPEAGEPGTTLPSAFASRRSDPAARSLDETIVENLPVALLVHCGERLYHANADFLALTGYASLDALRAAGGLDSLFDDYAGDTETKPLPGTMRLIRADGSGLAVNARLQSVNWHDGHALMLTLAEARDETTGSAASDEGALRAATLQIEVEELRSILETATDGVIILGEHGDIRSMNRSASALFDYDEAETRGQPFAKLFAHESQRAVMDYLNGLSEHGVASVLNDGREVIGREASGGFLPLFMTIGRLSGSNGYCAVMRDVTQWKRTEEELRAAKYAAEQASSHKSEFLARVSHEIRTPLNAIIGFADMMAEQRFGPIGSSRYLEYAHDIGRSGKHVLDIVNDLLDISKIEAGEMEVSFAAVALNETIAEAVSLLQPQANSQRVIIRTSLSSSVPEIVADQRSIKQIALNLVSNAIRFTPPGGQIVVSTAYEANGCVVLRIRDTGVGMSRSELDQAMKPFRQLQGTSRPHGDGTGLGLPLTKAMVEANRAQFDIRSAPQEGTLIEITFPSQRVLAD